MNEIKNFQKHTISSLLLPLPIPHGFHDTPKSKLPNDLNRSIWLTMQKLASKQK